MKLKVKIGERLIEIFSELQRVAVHPRDHHRRGTYVTEIEHLPENARAYVESTPHNVLSQLKLVNAELHNFIDELFEENALGHLRRGQGFVREARRSGKTLRPCDYNASD